MIRVIFWWEYRNVTSTSEALPLDPRQPFSSSLRPSAARSECYRAGAVGSESESESASGRQPRVDPARFRFWAC